MRKLGRAYPLPSSPGRRVAEAAGAAIADAAASARSPTPSAKASCARQELSGEVLRQVTRAAKRKREADSEYEQAITRAGRLALSQREIAAAAQVSHGTIRAILTRGTTIPDNGQRAEEQAPDSELGELAA
jgi:DNA-directed RNA polymerase specialized sigma24 family protein